MPVHLRVMIVEDEPLAARRLARLLREDGGVEIVGIAENGRAALAAIEAARPNLLLLDIEMPGIDGFALLERLPAGLSPAIIFVTAFDRYAYKAFGVRAVDFVLKPVAADRLAAALDNARSDIESRAAERKLAELQSVLAGLRARLPDGDSPYDREFWIQQRSQRVRVPAAEIDWIEAEKDYVRLHSGAHSYMLLGLIASVERRLDPGQFMRIHRSAIVRLDKVRSVHRGRYGALDVELEGGPRLRVGRKYAGQLRSVMARRA